LQLVNTDIIPKLFQNNRGIIVGRSGWTVDPCIQVFDV